VCVYVAGLFNSPSSVRFSGSGKGKYKARQPALLKEIRT